MRRIADSGLLIAALDARDEHHTWARKILERTAPPWLVCEAVLGEVCAGIGTMLPVLEMLTVGDLEIAFELRSNFVEVHGLGTKYKDQDMDLADACVVRMAELMDDCVVYTVDRKDFEVYRRNGRHRIPCVFPPVVPD